MTKLIIRSAALLAVGLIVGCSNDYRGATGVSTYGNRGTAEPVVKTAVVENDGPVSMKFESPKAPAGRVKARGAERDGPVAMKAEPAPKGKPNQSESDAKTVIAAAD